MGSESKDSKLQADPEKIVSDTESEAIVTEAAEKLSAEFELDKDLLLEHLHCFRIAPFVLRMCALVGFSSVCPFLKSVLTRARIVHT